MEDGVTTIPTSSSSGPHPIPFPAAHNWFTDSPLGGKLPTPRLERHLGHYVPYELILDPHGSPVANERQAVNVALLLEYLEKSESPAQRAMYQHLGELVDPQQLRQGNLGTGFLHFHAPLALIHYAMLYNAHCDPAERVSQLYIAQLPLTDLPDELREDVPTPPHLTDDPPPEDDALPDQHQCRSPLVDIYNSSLWLGLEPTLTPWHRDPNPNLLCQLVGVKKVRLAAAPQGEVLLRDVAASLGRPPDVRSALRGVRMMERAQREAEMDAVWGPEARSSVSEVVLEPFDMLYIPTGWWHSVMSGGADRGGLNMSVNWWFRTRIPRPRG